MNDKDQNQIAQPAAAPRQQRAGVFDNKKDIKAPIEPENKASQPKQNLEDPFVTQGQEVRERAAKAKKSTDSYAEDAANKINKSMIGADGELEDIEISEADVKLAEELIFNGYAETDVVMDSFPDHKFTICSTNAEEIGIIDDIMFDTVKEKEDDQGRVDMPQNKLQTMRNSLFVALGYKGRDGVELCQTEKGKHLNLIKKAIVRLGDLISEGNIEEAEKLNSSLKDSIKIRARRVSQMSTQMIDFLSTEKYKFDKKMYYIMTTKGVVPKS